jgi:hypothetical protein
VLKSPVIANPLNVSTPKNKKAIMTSIPEKEILFNRYYTGEMDKSELTELVKRLLLEKELRE